MGRLKDHCHPWEVSLKEAVAIQEKLKPAVKIEDDLPARVETVAGIDVGFREGGKISCAAVAVLDFPALTLCAQARAEVPTRFPYLPGLLAFRELPAVLEALKKLARLPDLILCDGQGIAHPRRLGIASHLGVLLDHPTIGVGKTRLVGTHDPVPNQRGAWVPLLDRGETVGAVLRTRSGVKPIYVSPGHRISLSSAVAWVMACTTRFRLPETTRWADRLSRSESGATGCLNPAGSSRKGSAAGNRIHSLGDRSAGSATRGGNNGGGSDDDGGGGEAGDNRGDSTPGRRNRSGWRNRNKASWHGRPEQ